MGGRSRAAAQLLSGKGFKDVYNLQGGINAWNGYTAAGPAEMGMVPLTGNETPENIIILSYGMEAGLGLFYKTIKDTAGDTEASRLLEGLANMEEKHKKRLFDLYTSLFTEAENIEQFEEKIVPG